MIATALFTLAAGLFALAYAIHSVRAAVRDAVHDAILEALLQRPTYQFVNPAPLPEWTWTTPDAPAVPLTPTWPPNTTPGVTPSTPVIPHTTPVWYADPSGTLVDSIQ